MFFSQNTDNCLCCGEIIGENSFLDKVNLAVAKVLLLKINIKKLKSE